MDRRTVARGLRAIRRRKGWSQRRLGASIGISKSEMSRWETTGLTDCSVAELERWAGALGAHVNFDLRLDGGRPLTDARHARIQAWLVNLLREDGWLVEAEASFNHYGDRGRIDALAYHPRRRIMLVAEVKSELVDIGDTVGRLDVKTRVAPQLARARGWKVGAIVPALIVREGSTARRRLAEHSGLFDRFTLRARAATAWLRNPVADPPSGLLLLVAR